MGVVGDVDWLSGIESDVGPFATDGVGLVSSASKPPGNFSRLNAGKRTATIISPKRLFEKPKSVSDYT